MAIKHQLKPSLAILLIVLFMSQSCAGTIQTTTPLVVPTAIETATLPRTKTPTPKPTATDSSAVPLTQAAIPYCPVSLPNVSKSPSEYFISTTNGYQNADGTLFTYTGPQGTVIFAPGGPGFILPDGSLEMKWGWWRGVSGKLTIEGRRLDAPAPPLRAEIPEGYGDSGFQSMSLIFPTQGCWEITGVVGNARLTFVTLVVKVSFRFIGLNWVPEAVVSTKYDTSNLPESLKEIYNFSSGGELITESAMDVRAIITPDPNAIQQKVTVWGQPGICVQGALVNQQWQDNVDAGFLEWTADGSIYRISHKGLGLRCDDLLRMPDQPR